MASRFEGLLHIADVNRVQVHFIPRNLAPEIEWDGLYLVSPQFGAGIAIRDDLEPEWRDWILAHELGHHFSKLNGTLFSPFCAHFVDAASRMRWSSSKRLSAEEQQANEWAVKTLVNKAEWLEAENETPCDLRNIISKLALPAPAAIAWGRYQRATLIADHEIQVPMTPTQLQVLKRSIVGKGGHQSFFRRLRSSREKQCVMLSFRDFSFARERAMSVEGGWQKRYNTILQGVQPLLEGAGSVQNLFRCTFTPLA